MGCLKGKDEDKPNRALSLREMRRGEQEEEQRV